MSQTSRNVNKSTTSRTVNERKASTKKTQDEEKTKKSTIAPTPDKKKLITKKSDSALIAAKSKAAAVPLKRKSIPATDFSKTLRGAPARPLAKVPVKAVKPKVSKGNVMNSIHNVTVASPPTSANKERTTHEKIEAEELPKSAGKARERTLTRTLDDDEILLLRNLQQPDVTLVTEVKPKIPVKEPVAFEVTFEDKKRIRPQLKSTPAVDEDDYDYESDFESYESDFESEVDETDNSIKSNEATEGSKSITEGAESSEAHGSTEEDSDNEQPQTQDKPENNLDSGNYDLTSKKSTVTPTPQLDSIDEFTVISHDSGISYDEEKKSKIAAFNKRGEELMKKITLDEMTFNIFEVPPIPYDVYMQLYGQTDTQQISTQTDILASVEATQTDDISIASIWTQFPPSFSKQGLAMTTKLYNEEKTGVGDGFDDVLVFEVKHNEMESISLAVEEINGFTVKNYLPKISQQEPSVQILNKFLQNTSLTISNILEKREKADTLKNSQISISEGFFTLKHQDVEVLKGTKATKLYSNLEMNNILLTVHHDAESSRNLICLWNILFAKSPLKIMTTWSEISCLEIHYQLPEVILMGSNDGSITLWDTNETIDWQEKVNGHAFLNPCQIVFSHADKSPAIAALKSLPSRARHGSFNTNQSIQICSLHENGLMTVWTIVKKQTQEASDDSSLLTPFSRIKLIKNLTINLNNTLSQSLKAQSAARKSSFDKTRYYFESDIFSDKILKELQQLDNGKVGGRDETLNFSCLDISIDDYFVATDSNYVMALSNFDQQAASRKIGVDDGNILHPTALKLHPKDNNVLAVGLSNGNLFFFSNRKQSPEDSNSDEPFTSKRSKIKDDVANMVSKSCAIQSIIENEKKVHDKSQALNNLEMDELKVFLLNEALAEQNDENGNTGDHAVDLKVVFDRSIFNSFGVNGRAVQMIEFNKNGEFLFVLTGSKVKIFNCLQGKMIETVENYEVKDVKCVSNYLVFLTTNQQIVINKLKN